MEAKKESPESEFQKAVADLNLSKDALIQICNMTIEAIKNTIAKNTLDSIIAKRTANDQLLAQATAELTKYEKARAECESELKKIKDSK